MNSWRTGNREKFLEGLYSLLASGYSQQTFSVCEERGGMLSATHWMPTILHLRNAVVDDQLQAGELHLLRMMPLAWLDTKQESVFEKMPTMYGPVTVKVKLADGGKTSFLGSINESRRAWTANYELLWEDASPGAVAWVQEEFDALYERFRQTFGLRRRLLDALARIPKELRTADDEATICDLHRPGVVDILHVIYRMKAWESDNKDYEFSARSAAEHRAAGFMDMTATLKKRDWFKPPSSDMGVVTHDIHAARR